MRQGTGASRRSWGIALGDIAYPRVAPRPRPDPRAGPRRRARPGGRPSGRSHGRELAYRENAASRVALSALTGCRHADGHDEAHRCDDQGDQKDIANPWAVMP